MRRNHAPISMAKGNRGAHVQNKEEAHNVDGSFPFFSNDIQEIGENDMNGSKDVVGDEPEEIDRMIDSDIDDMDDDWSEDDGTDDSVMENGGYSSDMDVSDNKEEFDGTDSGELAGTDGITSFEARWMERFDELKEFKRINGHFNISRTNSEYPGLGRWVKRQRSVYKNNEITDDREQRLNDIGFSWVVNLISNDQLWEQRYNELKEFKSINGNCIVSETNADYPGLGRWANNQRRAYKNNKITDDRVERLKDIGFEWSLK